ncbi:MAG: hypothetical protein KC484_07020 [Colwelliaceae bacterium]|nr:hypothetical protein [Colwelliaceae bacterium]
MHCLLAPLTSRSEQIPIYIRDDVYYDYLKFIDGKDILEIQDFSGRTMRRDVVDMILAQQALKLGGFEHSFEYFPGKLNFRNTKLLEAGKLLISFDSYWSPDALALKELVHISLPVIRKGEYVAAIYTSPTNKAVLAINELSDLKNFTAVTTPKWRTDWRILKGLPIKELIQEDEWLSMARMVDLKWVDFILMAFHSTPDQSFTLGNIHLVPVKNIAIDMKDSRHFVISKKHPLGSEAIKAINIGLTQLRIEKRISEAYQQAGFFIDKSKVKIINN